MTRPTVFRATFVVFTLLTLAAGGAEASAAAPATPASAAPSGLDERIDMQLEEADVQQVLASFGAIVSMEADVDPAIEGEVTIELHNVRAATALTAVCESVGCRWRIEDGRLTIEKDPEAPPAPRAATGRAEGPSAERLDTPIDLELEDADLRQVLQAFGSIVQARVALDESLQGEVTIQLHDTPVRQALDAVCRVHGCTWELQETDNGPVLKVTRR